MLALEALPIAVEGLELSASDLEHNENDDPEDAVPTILTCSSCDTLWSIAGHGLECPICHTNVEVRAEHETNLLRLTFDSD
jgi:Zn finger protein HypA/HybF involved in hydrogenase expression